MQSEQKKTKIKQQKRALRVRRPLLKVMRPRLSVFRSAKHISAQIIDDQTSTTLVGIGSYSKAFGKIKEPKTLAKEVGLKIALLAKEKNIQEVVFDRGRYKFHGRVAALAEGAREGGLSF